MTGRELLDFLLKQSDESLSLDISLFDNEWGVFLHIDNVYTHNENGEDGSILNNGTIVLEVN